MTPVTEVDQLNQQNALLLKRLLLVSRQRDELAKQLAALTPAEAATDAAVAR